MRNESYNSCWSSPYQTFTTLAAHRTPKCKAKSGDLVICVTEHGERRRLKRHRPVYTHMPLIYATNTFQSQQGLRLKLVHFMLPFQLPSLCPTDLLGQMFCPQVKSLSCLLLHYLVYGQNSFIIHNKFEKNSKPRDSCLSHPNSKHGHESKV